MFLIGERLDEHGAARRIYLCTEDMEGMEGMEGTEAIEPSTVGPSSQTLSQTHSRDWRRVLIVEDGRDIGAIPLSAVVLVMNRYGRPLDDSAEAESDLGPSVQVRSGWYLQRLRFRARVDALGRDYLVWRVPDQPALAALATTVVAALCHLASALPGGDP